MKSFITFLALLFTITANAQKILKTDSVYITGKIGKFEAYKEKATSVQIVVNDLVFGKQQTYSADINPDGTYKLSFLKINTQDVTLRYNNYIETILVEPGKHLQINFDADDLINSITFAGDDAALNRELITYQDAVLNDTTLRYRPGRSDFINKSIKDNDPEAYKKLMAGIYAKETTFLNNYLKQHSVSRLMKNWATMDLKYQHLRNLMFYPLFHAYFNKLKDGSFKVPDSYYDFINPDDLNNVEGLISSNYGKYVSECHYHLIDVKFGNSSSVDSLFDYLFKRPAGLNRDIILSNEVYGMIKRGNLDYVKPYLDRYKLAVQQPQVKANILKAYNDQVYLQNNAALPAATRINKVPKTASDSVFSKILAKYAGKVIYVDFWATWCGPCREEMPDSKNLHKTLAGKDVVFLYMGVECAEKAWKAAIAEMGIEGEHFLLSDNDYHAISAKFKINSIPRYFLVDKQGRVIEQDAKRPSDDTLRADIEKLLAAK